MPIQLGQDCFYGPDENPGIPIEVAAFHESFRQIRSRFFPEADNFEKIGDGSIDFLATLNVAISRTGPSRSDPDNDQITRLAGDGRCGAQVGLKRELVLNQMVSWKYDHRRIR